MNSQATPITQPAEEESSNLVNDFSSFARMPSPKLKLINLKNVRNDYIKPLVSSFNNVKIVNLSILARTGYISDFSK